MLALHEQLTMAAAVQPLGPSAAVWRFGSTPRFELQPQERRLLVDGVDAGLGGRALDVLRLLVERAGQLVTRNELLDGAWPGVVVEDNNLSVQMNALRKVLGGKVVETIPGRGYRFGAAVEGALAAPPTAAAPAAAPGLRTNLAASLTPLIGRQRELAELQALLDTQRLVTLVGAGGIGKTLLAQHVLAAQHARHAHGACWVELAPLSDGASIPAAIAAALGVQAGGSDALTALGRVLAPLQMLIALDNAEHLQDEVARVAATLHRQAPQLRLLVTSQAPLRLMEERVVRIEPLAVPGPGHSAAEALGYGAVALFVERAGAADARFRLTETTAPQVVELCRALDGVALAIELAAARVAVLGVQRLANAMHERLRLLNSSPNRFAPARQRTLRAALEWSHGLLAEREQAVFRRLAVVAGSASLAFIQRIAGCERWDEWDVLDALDTLVERSLVVVLAGAADEAPRYRLLESPRAYARERLEAAGEAEAVRRRHALAVCAALTPMTEREQITGSHFEAMAAARLELDNAREAFAWAVAGAEPALAVELGCQLLRLLTPASIVEGLRISDRLEGLLAGELPAALKADAWSSISAMLCDARQARAIAAARQAVGAARSLDARAPRRAVLLYRALAELAVPAAAMGLADEARAAADEAFALEQPQWPPGVRAYAANASFRVMSLLGEPSEAVRLVQRALALNAEADVRADLTLISLVDIQLSIGDARAAVQTGRELVARLEGTRELGDLAYARLNLAAAHLALDEADAARPLLEAGWAQTAQFDFMAAYLADYLALYAMLERRPADAARLAGYADARYAAFDDNRQPNEAAALARALAVARTALGDDKVQLLQQAGTLMSGAQVPACAFGSHACAHVEKGQG
jgi:predicted ATPase/DNA-binding winged helix-turn-helix (wHTH) protein